jgi:hypothetical protein
MATMGVLIEVHSGGRPSLASIHVDAHELFDGSEGFSGEWLLQLASLIRFEVLRIGERECERDQSHDRVRKEKISGNLKRQGHMRFRCSRARRAWHTPFRP